jgi:hypothetical protein
MDDKKRRALTSALSRLQLLLKLFSISTPIEVDVHQAGYFPRCGVRCGTKLARSEQRKSPVCVLPANRALPLARSAGLEPATF